LALEIRPAYGDIDRIKTLFEEYRAMLGIDLQFQNYDAEFQNLPGDYAPPRGRLYLAVWDGRPAGCVALHPYDGARCEIKRLFVRPEFRGKKIGRALVEQTIADAKKMGYRALVLDTLPFLDNSIALYKKLGFEETEPYRYNPVPGALYLSLTL
jgi:putative acetyltransferase